ncbi:MAG: metallophosphoesterase [Clostridia bacterium]|nr:metallophosphoesterase [Clostridia bacterium]
MLITDPVVFAVGNDYHIMAPVDEDCLYGVEVGGEKFLDEANGVFRSDCRIHRAIVPMEVLSAAGECAVFTRKVADGAPDSPAIEGLVEMQYDFQPLVTEEPRVYVVSDTHCQIEEPIAAAKAFGKIDLLILNGDIPDCAYNHDFYLIAYRIAAAITHGNIPVVMARGNHDLRGYIAEHYAEYFPNQNGNTYYTFRVGSIWGIVLDGGEDKPDEYPDYSGIVCCHRFRQRQTAFIKQVTDNAANEYAADGVKLRLVVCHNPFVHRMDPPFDIEQEIYAEWAKLLQNVNPHYMICGHLHCSQVHTPDDGWSTNGTLCPVLVGGIPGRKNPIWHGMGIEFFADGCHVTHNNNNGEIVLESDVPKASF